MKKLYSTPNLLKAVSLGTAMAALLSSVSPVFAAGVSTTGGFVRNSSGADVPYPHGSHGSIVFAGDDDYCGVDNVIGRGGKQQENLNNTITAKQEFENFILDQADNNSRNPYGTTTQKVTWMSDGQLTQKGAYMSPATGGSTNIMPEAYGVYSFVTGCGASATGNYSTAFGAGATTKAGGAQAFGVSALASGRASVAIGVGSEASGLSTVAIGGLATASGKDTVALGTEAKAEKEYAIAIGARAEALKSGAIAIGGVKSDRTEQADPKRKAIAEEENAIAIGSHTYAKMVDSVAIGANAQALVADGVAIGGGSVSRIEKGKKGYNPVTDQETTETGFAWKSTAGAFSVGDAVEGELTRQITNVAAGSQDTDAVNVAQLKALRDVIAGGGGWKVSVSDGDSADVNAGNTVDFSVKNSNKVGKDNLKIETQNEDNKHKIQFTLNDKLELTRVTTGQATMSDDGFFINGENGTSMTVDGFYVNGDEGPSMTVDGIDANYTNVKNVLEATEDHEAVNFGQLKKYVKENGGGWKLAVEEGEATDINPSSTVHFFAIANNGTGKKNIKIANTNGQNVSFDLADDISVMSVTAGESIMDASGFRFENGDGPSITVKGIHAGDATIKGVAEGKEDTDAVNFGQLQKYVEKNGGGWKLSVDGENATDVKAGSTVDFAAAEGENGSKNIKIEKDKNNVTFALADNINVMSVTAGESIMDASGFRFENGDGPSITVKGIHAGDATIKGVAEGKEDTDAVNFGQLQKYVEKNGGGWKLSVENGEAADVGAGSTVDFSAVEGKNGSKNIKIVKGDDNKVIFDLADNITVTKVTAGRSSISDDGIVFNGGARITVDGIDAGNEKITGVVAGEDDTDAVNYKQLKELKELATQGWKLSVNGKDATDVKAGSTVDFVGVNAEEGNEESKNVKITRGNNNTVKFELNDIVRVKRVIAGKANVSDNGFVITGGPNMTTGGINAGNKQIKGVAEGTGDTDAVNFAQLNKIKNEIAGDSLVKWDEKKKSITIGAQKDGTKIDIANKSGEARTISGVKDGEISEDSTDAINGSQLYSMADKIANYFGGGAQYEDEKWTDPTFKVSQREVNGTIVEKEYHNVADAFGGVDNSITDIYNQIKNVTENNLVKQEGENSPITIGKATGGTVINITNKSGADRTISGVKDGELSRTSTEAVNGSQLFTTNQNVNTVTNNLTTIAQNTSKYFGGSTDVLEGIEPAFLIDGKTHHNVTDAFTGVNVSIKNINDKIINMKENNLVQQEGISGVITIGAKTAGTEINIAGVGGLARKISGVQAAEKGDEAVNKDQLDKSIKGITKDALLWDDDEQAFVAHHEKNGEKTKSKLKFLLDGDISQDSTDAINGSQLYSMGNNIANYFGGGAKYENGKWTAPNFKISKINADGTVGEKTNHNNVAEALDDVNGGMVNINNRINDVINKVDTDALKWNKDKGAYDANRNGQPSKIINVADGKIAEGSKDAVNGGQLWQTNERISGVEKDVKHISNRVDNISNTIADIGDTVININGKVDNIENKVNDIAEDAVRYDRDENGKKTNKITLKGGNESEPVMIDNVADGRIEKGSKEAVNGGQLHDYTKEQMKIVLDESKHYTDQRVNNIVIDAIDDAVERANNYTNIKFEALNYNIENARKEAKQAAAIGLAVSNLRYNDTPGKLSVAFGSGLWRSQSAFAFGAGYTSENGKIRSNLSATSAGGHWGVGIGLNLTLN
ncbi:Vomp family autotransporter [Bartonella jaculi]|uniref:YadA-like family protein n=1 Tax=Bartonella jaculi TaxID=686226 RepID=A0ABP9N6Q9_9HYPH